MKKLLLLSTALLCLNISAKPMYITSIWNRPVQVPHFIRTNKSMSWIRGNGKCFFLRLNIEECRFERLKRKEK
ncbi:hypothetical protein [Pedobacter sp. FW305-3-2-15-E-R2A2]|jgi:hypothetical protein|uniref:hypothetical protein n=1 Tax=Pedobacter sp. FW305-3-2-15-E-R2A2 TaxID=3140251 RepID=UPI0031401497